MAHAFMYPRVTQIAPRAHSVRAEWLGTRPLTGSRDLAAGRPARAGTRTQRLRTVQALTPGAP